MRKTTTVISTEVEPTTPPPTAPYLPRTAPHIIETEMTVFERLCHEYHAQRRREQDRKAYFPETTYSKHHILHARVPEAYSRRMQSLSRQSRRHMHGCKHTLVVIVTHFGRLDRQDWAKLHPKAARAPRRAATPATPTRYDSFRQGRLLRRAHRRAARSQTVCQPRTCVYPTARPQPAPPFARARSLTHAPVPAIAASSTPISTFDGSTTLDGSTLDTTLDSKFTSTFAGPTLISTLDDSTLDTTPVGSTPPPRPLRCPRLRWRLRWRL